MLDGFLDVCSIWSPTSRFRRQGSQPALPPTGIIKITSPLNARQMGVHSRSSAKFSRLCALRFSRRFRNSNRSPPFSQSFPLGLGLNRRLAPNFHQNLSRCNGVRPT